MTLKLVTLSKLINIRKSSKKKIVLSHGVFDVFHYGHKKHFESAKKFGDILVVSLTSDKFVNKGPGRPFFNQNIRSDLKDRLSLMSNKFLSVIGATMSKQCDADRTQFRLDFSEGGHNVKLIDIDTSTVGKTVSDIQRLFGELEAIFSERDTTRIAFQSDSGDGELASTRSSKPNNPEDEFYF